MKRLFLLVLCLAAVCCLFSETARPAQETGTTIEESKLHAQSAVLMDADSGRVLFEKQGDAVLPMASTTKIMTCILTLERANLEDAVNVSDYASSMPKVRLSMHPGETYRLKDLLYSLMLESHNDSAVAIAEHVGGSVEGFADMMNQKAAEIGCENTCFLTPNGLDAQKDLASDDGGVVTVAHSTTAKDLARIMSYCVTKSPAKDAFLAITREPSHSFSNLEGTRSFSCSNHNAFLNMMEGALSGKTGFTGKAGYCYVGALERDGRTFVVSLLACGWPNNKTYKWADTKKLMKYGVANYQKRDLSAEPLQSEWLSDIPVKDAKTDGLYGEAFAELAIKDEEAAPSLLMKEGEQVSVSCSVQKELSAPVEAGQQVGSVTYSLDGAALWERKICVKQSVERRDYLWFFKMTAQNFLF